MNRSKNKKLSVKKETINLAVTLFASALSAFGLWVFVYPANFAPSGIDGIATMLQSLVGWNAGYFSLILNFPLLVLAFIFLKKRYVIYTVLFTLLSSGMLLLLEFVDFYQYVAESDKLIAAIFSGIILGVRTGIMLKIGASTGGVDVAACIIQKKRPYARVERLISFICYIIIGASYFVYRNFECILFSVVQMLVFEKASSVMLMDTRNAVEVKIVTKSPEKIRQEILYTLKHGATIVESKGMFTEEGNSIIFLVINTRQLPEFLSIIKKHPDTFVYYGDVKGVNGNFRWFKDDVAK